MGDRTEVEIRSITEEEVEDFMVAGARGFGIDRTLNEGDGDRFLSVNALEATMIARDRGHIVATFGSYDLDLTVPGGESVTAAGTSHVTVHPTHRRQGILTEMMTRHLNQAIERGQPMAALWSSEDRIYQRFGYGQACSGLAIDIPANTVTLPSGPDDVTVHPLTTDEAAKAFPSVYEEVRLLRPGLLRRSEDWWELRVFLDAEHWRNGFSRLRYVSAERSGQPVGYIAYRQRDLGMDEEGITRIIEFIAVDDDVRRTLWHFITNIDLHRHVTWWNAPVDEPMLLEVDRFRSVKSHQVDTLWLRPLDVVRVLETRRYERDGSIVLGVDDPFLGRGGTFRLDVNSGIGTCRPSDEEPQVTMDISVLGRLYLGGHSAHRLARAALIQGSAEAVHTTDELFVTLSPPTCIEIF